MNPDGVVISGIGLITPVGDAVDSFVEALWSGRSGIGLIKRWDCSTFPVRFGGECADFDPCSYGIDARDAKRMDRFAQFALAAAIRATSDAELDFSQENPARCGVIIGSGIGGFETIQEQYKNLLQRGGRRGNPFTGPKMMNNPAHAHFSNQIRLQRTTQSNFHACLTRVKAS